MKRVVVVVLLIDLVLVLSCARSIVVEREPLTRLLSRARALESCCRWEEAEQTLDQAMRQHPAAIEPWLLLGKLYEAQGEHARAVHFWDRILAVRTEEHEAIVGRWRSLLALASSDRAISDSLFALVRTEVETWHTRIPRTRLSLEVSYEGWRILGEGSLARRVGSVMAFRHPDTKLSMEFSSSAFYDSLSQLGHDKGKRIRFLRRFLADHPVSPWRGEAYARLASALSEKREFDVLVRTLRSWRQESPDDPRALNTSAFLFLENNLGDYRALQYARRALDAVARYRPPDGYPAQRWKLERHGLESSAGTNYARALLRRGDYETAARVAEDVIAGVPRDVDSDVTAAAARVVLAQSLIAQKYKERGAELLVQALIEGDVGNIWTSRAESVLAVVLRRMGVLAEPVYYARAVSQYHGPRFVDVTSRYGLMDIRGGRVAWGDYDGDGWVDLLIDGRSIFRNIEGRRFTETSQGLGLGSSNAFGGLWADVDNDGDLDLFLAATGNEQSRDQLLLFRSGAYGAVSSFPGDDFPTEGAAFCDFDGDGWLDLYLAKYEKLGARGEGPPDRLLMNGKNGVFIDKSNESGIGEPYLAGRGVNCGDYDNDGDQDIFVSNHRLQPNLLWENDGSGRFVDVSCVRGVRGVEKEGWWGHTIGSAWGDYDNDGDLDLISANLAHPRFIDCSDRTMLLVNDGQEPPRFKDMRAPSGIVYAESHCDPAWADVDSDGDLDLFITSIYKGSRSFLYLNDHGRFKDVTYLAGVRVLNGWGCAFADFDRDGDEDLVVGSEDGVRLFRNQSSGHWLNVAAVGNGSSTNRDCIGCRVSVTSPSGVQIREIQCGKGTMSLNSLIQHFGFGTSIGPVAITVRFSDGEMREVPGVALDQLVVVYQ